MKSRFLLLFTSKTGFQLAGQLLAAVGIFAFTGSHIGGGICGMTGVTLVAASEALELPSVQRRWTLFCFGCVLLLGLIGVLLLPDSRGIACGIAAVLGLGCVGGYVWFQKYWRKKAEKTRSEAA